MARSKVRGITVAGLRVAIEAPPDLPWEWPEGPLRRFASEAADAAVQVGVRVGRCEAPPATSVRYDSGGGIFDVALDGRDVVVALRIRGRLQRVARFDEEFRVGEVVVSPDSPYARECWYPLAYPLDEVVFLHRLVREGALLLHACGIVRGGSALVFTGPSGAGKTTLARLFQRHAGAEVLSDDRLVLRLDPEGPGSGVRVWGTPWHGEAPLSMSASAPLAAVHLIRHAPEVLAEPVAGATAAAALLGNAFVPAHEPRGAAAALDFAARMVERVPLIRLGFPKDARVVRYAYGASMGAESAHGRPGLAAPGLG